MKKMKKAKYFEMPKSGCVDMNRLFWVHEFLLPQKIQTPEMMSTGAVDVHVLFLNS